MMTERQRRPVRPARQLWVGCQTASPDHHLLTPPDDTENRITVARHKRRWWPKLCNIIFQKKDNAGMDKDGWGEWGQRNTVMLQRNTTRMRRSEFNLGLNVRDLVGGPNPCHRTQFYVSNWQLCNTSKADHHLILTNFRVLCHWPFLRNITFKTKVLQVLKSIGLQV